MAKTATYRSGAAKISSIEEMKISWQRYSVPIQRMTSKYRNRGSNVMAAVTPKLAAAKSGVAATAYSIQQQQRNKEEKRIGEEIIGISESGEKRKHQQSAKAKNERRKAMAK